MKNIIQKGNRFSLAINSSLIAITTFVIAVILHEGSHFIFSILFGLKAELHHDYVAVNNATELQGIYIAGAGPIMSLFFGIVFLNFSKKMLKPSVKKLFFLWLGLNNLLMFLGYMLIAPFVKSGDTGKVLDFFNVPFYLSILLSILFLIFIIILFKNIVSEFEYYKSEDNFDINSNANYLLLFPILSSIIVNSVLIYPSPTIFSYLPTLFTPLPFLSTYFKYKRTSVITPVFSVNRISLNCLFLFIMFILLFRYLN